MIMIKESACTYYFKIAEKRFFILSFVQTFPHIAQRCASHFVSAIKGGMSAEHVSLHLD